MSVSDINKLAHAINPSLREEDAKLALEQGQYGPRDRRILINGCPIKLETLARAVKAFYQNESILYPPPRFRGGELTLEFLSAFARTVTDSEEESILFTYKLRQ